MSKGCSQFEENIKTFFSKADKDKNGSLTCLELHKVLEQAGCSPDDTSNFFSSIDKNKDNKITLEELLTELQKRDPRSVEESELRAQFQKFDKDGSGYITAEELQEILTKYGRKGSAAKYIDCVDKNGDGKINFEEFLKMESELRAQFKKFDKDGSGYITAEELQEILKKYGKKGSAEKYIDCVDKDADDKINYEEFLKMWKGDN